MFSKSKCVGLIHRSFKSLLGIYYANVWWSGVWTSVSEFRSKNFNSKLVGVSYKETNQKLSYIETNKINSITQNNQLTPSFNIFELKPVFFDFQSFSKVSNFEMQCMSGRSENLSLDRGSETCENEAKK